MAILDELTRVSLNQAVTASAVSTNSIDLSVNRDIGEGKPLYALFTVTEAFTNNTSLTFEVITASGSALTGTIQTYGSTGAILVADLVVGAQFVVELGPLIGSTGQRYLGARYTIGGSNATAGKVTCDITNSFGDVKKRYPRNYVA